MINKKSLLSIAIPTWNRAKTLSTALDLILPQVQEFKNEIQLVISDNASTDNTKKIIEQSITNYPDLYITHYTQEHNTGFFGNFTKVKELSTGKFIWLLSDDDYVAPTLINEIISILRLNDNMGVIFLYDWKWKNGLKYSSNYIQTEELFNKINYRLTLISATIFYNEKENETDLMRQFKNSNFIGLIFLTSIFRIKKESCILYGNSISVGKDEPKGYNWFQAFILDINEVFRFMLNCGYKKETISKFKSSLFENLILYKYSRFKAYTTLESGLEIWPLKQVNKLLYKFYLDNFRSLLLFLPYFIIPSVFLKFFFVYKKKCKIKIIQILRK